MTEKIRSVLRRRDGFTLVETITATAMLVVLIGVCSALIITAMSSTARSTALIEQQSLGSAIYDYVSDCLRYADAVELGSPDGPETVKVQDGLLVRRRGGGSFQEVYSRDLYGGCALELAFSAGSGERTVALTVRLTRDGETRYEQTGTVRLLNAPGVAGSGSGFSFTTSA